MISELIQKLKRNKSLQWLVLLLLLFFFVILAIMLWPREGFEQHKAVKTHLAADRNFGYMHGTSLYAYNGLAFYKINRASSDTISILHEGTKLPTPRYIYWANDHGAIIDFKESFLATQVEDEIRSRGLRLNQTTQSYTWYLDFASGSLSLVNEQPIQPRLVVFSEKDQGFYYIPQTSASGTSLHFYDIKTKQGNIVAENLNIVDASYLGNCPGHKVCFVGRDPDDSLSQRLYGINQSNQKTQILDSHGRVFHTNDDNLIISVEAKESSHKHTLSKERYEEEEDEVYEEAPARLHNLKQNSVQELGFDVGNADIITHIRKGGEYFVVDNSLVKNPLTEDELHNYRAGKLKGRFGRPQNRLFPFTYFDDKPFTKGIISASHSTANESLLTTFENNQVLFTTEKPEGDFVSLDRKAAENKVDECVNLFAQDWQYFGEERLFKIFFMENADFDTNIKQFSKCLLESGMSGVVGFNYYFGGLDSLNGRITTD